MWESLVGPIRDHLAAGLLVISCLGAVTSRLVQRMGESVVRRTFWFTMLLSAGVCVWMVSAYEPLKETSSRMQLLTLGPLDRFQFRTSLAWIGGVIPTSIKRTMPDGTEQIVEVAAADGPGIRFDVGVDGLSLWFVVLSVLLIAVAAGADADGPSPSRAASWLWAQAGLIGTLISLDVVLLSLSWLVTWLAIGWLMGHDGNQDRRDATFRLLKTVGMGASIAIVGLMGVVQVYSWLRESPMRPQSPLVFSIPEILHGVKQLTSSGERLIFWGSVRVPLYWLLVIGFTWTLMLAPFHRGFVSAIGSAPVGVAMVVAGVGVKVGLYGWLRIIVPLFGDLLQHMAIVLMTALSVFSLFGAILALGQSEWRSRVALATASSLGLAVLGAVTLTLPGLISGVLRGLSHGLSIPLLIWLWGRDERRAVALSHEVRTLVEGPLRETPQQLAAVMSPDGFSAADGVSASTSGGGQTMFRLAIAAAIGMPGFAGFVSDVLQPIALFQEEFNIGLLSLMTSGVLAWTWVRAMRADSINFGPWHLKDWVVAGALLSANVGLGLFPQFVIDRLQPTLVQSLPVNYESLEAAGQEP